MRAWTRAPHRDRRAQPPVGDHHSVANELWSRPDNRPERDLALYLERAQEIAREEDPMLPISVDINGRPHHPEQFTYYEFDMLGIIQYFGWYRWVEFDDLPLYLQEMRDPYPDLALVMTEFGAEPARSGPTTRSPEGQLRLPDLPLQAHPGRGRRRADLRSDYRTLASSRSSGWSGGAGQRPPPSSGPTHATRRACSPCRGARSSPGTGATASRPPLP